MNKYRRIKYEDRCQIYALSKRGSSQESIAEVLGVSQSAVRREMQRNRGQRGYRFKQAEAKSQARQAIRSKGNRLLYDLKRRGCQGRTFAQRQTSKIPRLPFTARGFPLPRLLLNFYALGSNPPPKILASIGPHSSRYMKDAGPPH